jgi:large subunit ribosomal protein L23
MSASTTKSTKTVNKQTSAGTTMALKPRISEKSYGSADKDNIYIFEVPKNANKQTITLAVESQFGVKVADVRTLNVVGKPKRAVRKRQRPASGKRKDIKKAYVGLVDGDSINIFGNDEKKTKAKKSEKPSIETKVRSKRRIQPWPSSHSR